MHINKISFAVFLCLRIKIAFPMNSTVPTHFTQPVTYHRSKVCSRTRLFSCCKVHDIEINFFRFGSSFERGFVGCQPTAVLLICTGSYTPQLVQMSLYQMSLTFRDSAPFAVRKIGLMVCIATSKPTIISHSHNFTRLANWCYPCT